MKYNTRKMKSDDTSTVNIADYLIYSSARLNFLRKTVLIWFE